MREYFKSLAIGKRAVVSLLLILFLMAPSLLTAFLRPSLAEAAQLTDRSITIGSSQASATDVTYSVSFTISTAITGMQGMVVQFCSNTTGTIVGTTCTGPSGMDTNKASLAVANQKINGVAVTNDYAVDTTNSTANMVILTNATGNNVAASDEVTFDLGSSGASDGITNPDNTDCSGDNNCTFYARIFTFDTVAHAQAYPANGVSPSNYTDYGGVALSIANQLTVSARVQEKLQFCVGGTTVNSDGSANDSAHTVASGADCSSGFTGGGTCGTTVDLGVLDSSVISTSPVTTNAGTPGFGNGCTGAVMVRTNASGGVVISYFADLNNGSGRLKVPGASCAGTQPDNTDQCFNNNADGAPYTAGQGTFTAGQEDFGMTVAGVNCNSISTVAYSCAMASGTNHLTADSGYIGNSATAFGDSSGFQWQDDGTAAQIASSTSPVDDEALILEFAATSGLVTPTGTYQVVSTYVATATF